MNKNHKYETKHWTLEPKTRRLERTKPGARMLGHKGRNTEWKGYNTTQHKARKTQGLNTLRDNVGMRHEKRANLGVIKHDATKGKQNQKH